MPKFNIYKVSRPELRNLVERITDVGLELTSSKNVDDYQHDFYFSTVPDEIDIWWVEFYKDLIELEDKPTNKVNFGLLLIYNEDICYAVSLGKSHFYIKPYCDSDFGINLAERIINVNDLRLKNSKFYKTKKNKTITSFQSNTELSYDSGESLHYLKAKTIDPDSWGTVASFGQSVLLSLNIELEDLTTIIDRIEATLVSEKITNIPKAEKITDEREIAELDRVLSESILDPENSNVDYQNFSLSGVDFIFSDNYRYQYYIKRTDVQSEIIDELDLQSLRDFVNQQGIDLSENLTNLYIRVFREEGRGFSKPLKTTLEFVTDNRECLLDGIWHRFNQSYVDLLKEYVSQIIINPHVPALDIDKNNPISETQFNENREQEGYLNLHTSNVRIGNFTIETSDLFLNGTLYFVKKGTPQKLGYVIDQALNTLNVLKSNIYQINNNGNFILIEKICLWLIIDRVNNVNQIDEINSIIFLMKLMHLSKEIQDSRLQKLELNINYIR